MPVWDGLSDFSGAWAEKNQASLGVILVANDLGGLSAEVEPNSRAGPWFARSQGLSFLL